MYCALVALLLGSAITVVGLVPWAALQYRRRGTLGIGNTVLAFASVVYALALVTYTLLPLPDTDTVAAACRSGPQLRPFAFVGDIAKEGGISGPRTILTNPAVAQVFLNVLLFVPLGMLVRHLVVRGRLLAGVLASTAVGFAVSLLIEFTQLTGDWFLYPCAYRLFDVDDLFANTLGALIGTFLSPVLFLFTRRDADTHADLARPVTLCRRAFGMICDVLTLSVISTALVAVAIVSVVFFGGDEEAALMTQLMIVLPFVAPVVQLTIVLITGRTLGEAVVRLRPVPHPNTAQRIVRWALGSGGWAALLAVDGWEVLSALLAVAAVIGLLATRERRGLANAVAQLGIEDERTPCAVLEPQR